MFSKRVEKGSHPQNAEKQKWVSVPKNKEKSQDSRPFYISTPNKSMKNLRNPETHRTLCLSKFSSGLVAS